MAVNTCDNWLVNIVGLVIPEFVFRESRGVSVQPTSSYKHKRTQTKIMFSSVILFYASSYRALYSQNLSLIFIFKAITEWTTKEFIDHATFSVSLLFSEYYFKIYINVNKIMADCFFIFTVGDPHALTQIKKFLKFSDLVIQNFSSQEKFL